MATDPTASVDKDPPQSGSDSVTVGGTQVPVYTLDQAKAALEAAKKKKMNKLYGAPSD